MRGAPIPIERARVKKQVARARSDAREVASRCFLRAAAALTEAATVDAIAFALLEASLGMLALAELDVGEKGRKRVEAMMKLELRTSYEPPR